MTRGQTQNRLIASRAGSPNAGYTAPRAIGRRLPTLAVLRRPTISIPNSVGGLLCYFGAICLFFTQTNYVPVSAAMVALLPAYPFLDRRLSGTLGLAIVSLTGYFLFSALLLDAKSLFDYDFYRRDGNFFVAWAPLLLLSRVQYRMDVSKTLRRFIIASSMICAVALVAWKLGRLRPEASEFFHLFYAHNAAGGFLAVACGFAIALTHHKAWKWVWAVAPLATGLVLTHSRGSLLGFALALVMVYLVPKRFVSLVMLLATVSTAGILYYGYSHTKGRIEYHDAAEWSLVGELGFGREHTISGRLYGLWPRAINGWLQSPIVGTGFGSFNDVPYQYAGREGVLVWSKGPVLHNDAHAHHSYAHVLAETGLVGLALLVWFLRCIYRTILDFPIDPAVRTGLLLGFWTLVFASFTEHRIVTPSNVLPFSLMLGLTIASANAIMASRSVADRDEAALKAVTLR